MPHKPAILSRPGRKPVDRLAAAAKPGGRQAIWEAIRARPEFTAREIERDTDVPGKTVRDYLGCLLAGGIVSLCGDGSGTRFCLLADPSRPFGAQAPRLRPSGDLVIQGLPTEQMWRTMKRLGGQFTAEELALAASTEAVPVSPAHAKDYCINLANAGYLRRVVGGLRRHWYVFLPHRDTGPLPPQVQRTTRIWDANLRRVVWPAETETSSCKPGR